MRILYVEDNLANLSLVQRLARVGDHEVISHPDGEAALANIDQDKPDLILMDVQLKGALTGLEVVKALRARGHNTPIIALTAYAMVGDRERCLEAGCDDYLPKPLPVEQLVEFFQRYDPKKATESTPSAQPAPANPATSDHTQAGTVTGVTPAEWTAKPAETGLTTDSDFAKPSPPETPSQATNETANQGSSVTLSSKEDKQSTTTPPARDDGKPPASASEKTVKPAGTDSSGNSG